MIPDIELDECIEMVTSWMDNALNLKKITNDFEMLIIAHEYKEIIRHLKAYQELKKEMTK